MGKLNFELPQHCTHTHLAHDLEDVGLGHLDISTRTPSELVLHRLCVRNTRVLQVPTHMHAHNLSRNAT